MVLWDYSAALLLQVTAWTMLQFRWLCVAVTIASLFLERTLHLALTPVAMAAIAHAFEEYCGGRGGGSADFAASAAPYVFAFHLVMGVRLVGLVLSWFGAGGGRPGGVPRGRSRGTTAREATMAAVWTDGGDSGGGAKGGAD